MRRFAIATFVSLVPAVAGADEISDEEAVCNKAELGAACTASGKPGTCQESKCARIDYSSQPPKSVERPCRICVAGAAKVEAPAKSDAPAPTETKGCAIDRGALSLGSIALGVLLFGIGRRRR
jgi:hypothetical protein